MKKILFLFLQFFILIPQGWGVENYTCSSTAPVRINQFYNPQAGNQVGYIELYVDQGPIDMHDWKICYSDNNGDEKCLDIGNGNGDLYLNGVKIGTDKPPTSIPDNAFLIYSETLFKTGGGLAENTFTQSEGEILLRNKNNEAVHYMSYTTSETYKKPEWSADPSCTTSFIKLTANNFGVCATPDFSLPTSQWQVDCNSTIGNYNSGVSPTPTAPFDAWEPSQGTIFPTTPKLYTKIASSPFPIHLGPKTGTFTGTACARVQPDGDWKAVYFNNETYKLINDLSYSKAVVSTHLDLWFKKDVNEGATNCPNYIDKNSSSDLFFMRPAYFSGTINGFTAGEQKAVSLATINANGSNNTNVLEYNTTVSTISNISISNHCESNTSSQLIDNLAITFKNGQSTLINAKFKDIGDFNATLVDSSWNDGDCISGSGSNILTNGKYGCNVEGEIHVIVDPYELNTTLQSFSPSSSPPWLYLDSSRSQYVEINSTIEAFGKDGTKSKNFSDGCASTAVPIEFHFTSTGAHPADINVSLTSTTGSQNNIQDINTTYTTPFNFSTPKESFKNGDANLSLKFNFIRSNSTPVNPFDLNLTSIKTSSGYIDNNATNLTNKATFVYGRIHPYDIKTDQSSVQNPIEIEIYGKNSTNIFLKNKPQNVLYWYRNTDHNASIIAIQSGSAKDNNNIEVNATIESPNKGLHNVYIKNPTEITSKQTILLNIPSWLTITPANHTFIYQYFNTSLNNMDQLINKTKGVNSGTFGGSDFKITTPKNTTKKGIKVFR